MIVLIYKWLSLVYLFTIKVKYNYYQSSDFYHKSVPFSFLLTSK